MQRAVENELATELSNRNKCLYFPKKSYKSIWKNRRPEALVCSFLGKIIDMPVEWFVFHWLQRRKS